MTLTDLLDVARWQELEEDISARLGMNPGVFFADGRKVTSFSAWVNPLCPAVRSVPNGLAQICACANQVICRKAGRNGPVVEECDAGLCKIAVPIYAGGDFLGVAGGCGVRLEGAALDLYHLAKVTGLPEERLKELAASVPTITADKAREAAAQISDWLKDILAT